MKTFRTWRLALLSAGMVASMPAQAIEYHLIDLGALPGYEDHVTVATGLNASGQVVGYHYKNVPPSIEYDTLSQGFVTGANGAGTTSLGTLGGGTWSQAKGVNDAGQVVGTARIADGSNRAFIGAAGVPLRDLGALGGAHSAAMAVNSSGQVVGWAETPGGGQRAFISGPHAGPLRDLGAPAGPATTALSIDERGRVVGTSGPGPSLGMVDGSFVTGPDGSDLRAYVAPGTPDPHRIPDVPILKAIGDNGQMLLVRQNLWESHGVSLIHADGTESPLDFLGVPDFVPLSLGQLRRVCHVFGQALNASGQVAGHFSNVRNLEDYAYITGPGGTDVTRVDELVFANAPWAADLKFQSVTDINDGGAFVANGAGAPT